MAMQEQCELVHEWSISKGFWAHMLVGKVDGGTALNPSIFQEKIALMHSELSEVLEARRDGNEELELEECADVLIRLMDYCGARGFNLGEAYIKKMKKNLDRPYLHGRKF